MRFQITPEFLASQGLSPTFPERFWAKVDKNGPIPDPVKYPKLKGRCWVWTGAIVSGGYGSIMSQYKNKSYTVIGAHRASWILHNGAIPDSLLALHKCDVRRCVNPSHLFLGTHSDNCFDAVKKKRWAPQFGIHNGHNKLSNKDVLEIRNLYSNKIRPISELARMFGVTRHCIWEIGSLRKWTHI